MAPSDRISKTKSEVKHRAWKTEGRQEFDQRIEDISWKCHKTFEEGAASVFLRVPENFDVAAWPLENRVIVASSSNSVATFSFGNSSYKGS